MRGSRPSATNALGMNVAKTETPYAAVVPTATSVFMSVRPWRAAESAPHAAHTAKGVFDARRAGGAGHPGHDEVAPFVFGMGGGRRLGDGGHCFLWTVLAIEDGLHPV